MEHEIITYLSKYVSLSDELIETIKACIIVRQYNRGSLLLNQGAISRESFFVINGCVRSFINCDGEEKTLEIYTEGQVILPLSYDREQPSEHSLECVEDCALVVNTATHEQAMFQQYPQFESVCRIMSEVLLSNIQESFVNFKTTSPEERYLYLLKTRPELFQRIPQYQLASYIGLKPESLSRLRKRLAKKQDN